MNHYIKDFDNWNIYKKNIDNYTTKLFCNERDVWWTHLGVNIDYEQDGKNQEFVRPVLVLKKFNNEVFLGIPLSTQLKQGNKYYIEFLHTTQQIAAVISQVRMFDNKRLKRKMYRLDEAQFGKIKQAVIGMLA